MFEKVLVQENTGESPREKMSENSGDEKITNLRRETLLMKTL